MGNIVKVKYNADNMKADITVNDNEMDTSRIENKKIEEWIYPFLVNGIRWKGFLNEIKEYLGGSDDFVVIFDGDARYSNLIAKSLEGSKARVVGENNNVIIIYRKETLSTIITVNGKAFDSSRIAGKTIEEWVGAFETDQIRWNGIFSELKDYIGIDHYSIQFSGDQNDMISLINHAPDSVDITVKAPASKAKAGDSVQKMSSAVSGAVGNITGSEQYQKFAGAVNGAVGNITGSDQYQKVSSTVSQAAKKVDQSISNAMDNISNSEQYQKIMANENIQKISQNSTVQKITGKWKGLARKYKIIILCAALFLVIILIIVGCSGKTIKAENDGIAKSMECPHKAGSFRYGFHDEGSFMSELNGQGTLYISVQDPMKVYYIEGENGETKETISEESDIYERNNQYNYDAQLRSNDVNGDGYIEFIISYFNGKKYVKECVIKCKVE